MTVTEHQRKLANRRHSRRIAALAGMTQAESLKEAIGWLKVVFGLLVAVDISLIAWLAQNYATANATLLLLAWAATMGAIVATIWVYVAAWRNIRILKDV